MKVVDLFCGCGGLSLGFMEAGFKVLAGIDFWNDAIEVYKKNFVHPVINQNLIDVEESSSIIESYSPEMIIGGPPCQDFSSAGKRDENNGRGDLTVSYAKIISTVRPEWFVMENVERIRKTQKLSDAVRIYKDAGYGLTCTVLDASLCGVPQKRKRFVMIGHLNSPDDFMNYHLNKNLAKKPMTVADYFGDMIGVKYYYRHPRSYARRGIFSTDEPSPTIRGVNRPMPNGYKLRPNDPVQTKEGIRHLTTKERSMIQTFPEDFIFVGSKTAQEQMIGNAVPVKLTKYIAEAIKQYIERFPNGLENSIDAAFKPEEMV
jgi:DNA (cytosine-5)-methyltransferase 1